jgi:hypothetical protein
MEWEQYEGMMGGGASVAEQLNQGPVGARTGTTKFFSFKGLEGYGFNDRPAEIGYKDGALCLFTLPFRAIEPPFFPSLASVFIHYTGIRMEGFRSLECRLRR